MEAKLARRLREVEELSNIIYEINSDNQAISSKIETEKVNADFSYMARIATVEEHCLKIQERIEYIIQEKTDILTEINDAISHVMDDSDVRLVLIERNLYLKKRVQATLKALTALNKLTKNLTSASLEVFKKVYVPYKPILGDDIDMLFAQALAHLNLNMPVARVSEGNYTLGSKKIKCNIVNGRLLVRVGGGYMAIEEYLEQYGKAEAGKHTLNLEITE